jgi:3-oxoacyl-(acyl-carrier-protein) synthase
MSTHREELKQLQRKLSTGPMAAEPIAIVGLHGYLPGAMSVREFWTLLDEERSAISEVPADRFAWKDHYDPSGQDPRKMRTRWGGFIPVVDTFDPLFFKIAPNDAAIMDPQQRLLLMSAWKAIEDAGHAPGPLRGTRTGVYIGAEDLEYLQTLKDAGVDLGDNMLNHHASMLANRISYCFDFRGPSEIVNTMCSSAAVALHRGAAALRTGEIDAAIVGGAKIILRPDGFIAGTRLNMISNVPSVKSFGKDAGGYTRAEGVATVMLKRLSDAQRDRNPVYAAIRSSAINFNGAGGMSFVAPNPEAHAEVIRRCYDTAAVDPRDVEYIEAQGMGAQVSDIAEWDAYNKAIQELCDRRGLSYTPGFCAISTLKPMIGHMECASAMGALFKIVHSFKTGTLYRILDFTEANPYLDTQGKPCRLLAGTEAWRSRGTPRLAGLHSYGSGGNNAHLLITEVIPDRERGPDAGWQGPELFVLSAKSRKVLEHYADDLAAFLASDATSTLRLEDVAFTLQVGRDEMSCRLAVVAASWDELRRRLRFFLQGSGETAAEGVFHGTVSKGARAAGESVPIGASPLSEGECERVASLWVTGGSVDWAGLHEGGARSRVSLPTYPFAQEHYWIPTPQDAPAVVSSPSLALDAASRRVVVVGAGPAGLAMAKCLQDEGFEPLVLEGSDRLGGIWTYRDNYASGPYKSTLAQLSKYTFFFSDFPPDERDPLFCDVPAVNAYLHRYVDHFRLRPRIKLECRVLQVSPEGRGWTVTYYHPREGICRITAMGVACCSGSFWQPALPDCAGTSTFTGLQITASACHSNEIFSGKRVLVVGAGVSGADIASDAAETAAGCTWSVRGLGWFLPRMAGFVPNDCSISLLRRFANLRMSGTDFIGNLRRALPDYMARYERTGLIPDATINNAIFISDRIVDRVHEGRIAVRPPIAGFNGNVATFSDGHAEEFDVVVYCTGYQPPTYEWLRPIRYEEFRGGHFHRDNPSLFICNHPPGAAFGAAPPYLELLARWYAAVLSGSCPAPTSDHLPLPAPVDAIYPERFFDTWLESLRIAHEIGVLPEARTDWTGYWRFINMPPIPALFRLQGPHAWAGAEAWLQHVRRKCFLGSESADTRELKLAILAGLQGDEREDLRRHGQITEQELLAATSYQGPRMTPWLTTIAEAAEPVPVGAAGAMAADRPPGQAHVGSR